MQDIATFREWSGRTILDRVDLVMLQVQNGLRPEVEWIARQILNEAGWHPSIGTRAAIEALFWGFRKRYRYTYDPWELDLFINCYRAWLVGGGSPDGDLSSGGSWWGDCDDSVIAILTLAYLVASIIGIRRIGAKVIGPKREFTHIYAGIEDDKGNLVFLDPTVTSFGPGQEAPKSYRNVEKFILFDPTRNYAGTPAAAARNVLNGLGDMQAPDLRDLDRSTTRNRIDGIVRRVYRSVRDPVTRTSAITMLRESGCPARDDVCDATAVLQGVRNRFWATNPVGGSVRTLGQVTGQPVGDSVEVLAGDRDDAAMAICSLALSLGFRSGVRTTPDGYLNAVVELPRSQTRKSQRRILDLPLESNVPIPASGGIVSWYSERR